ncbi:hypothetical protein ALT785_580195 [Alteromonas infernus]
MVSAKHTLLTAQFNAKQRVSVFMSTFFMGRLYQLRNDILLFVR